MRTFPTTRMASGLAALALLAAAGTAHAATVIPFGGTAAFTDTTNDSCRGDLAGAVSGTQTVHGEVILQPSGELTFVDADQSTMRVDYVDGSYALGSSAHHYTSTGVHGDGTAQTTETNELRLTIYNAAGQRLGTENGGFLDHITLDLATGVVHVEVTGGPTVCSL